MFAREGTHVLSRFFFDKYGSVVEDPGTGSACANLGGWLLATGRHLPQKLTVDQGEAVGRPCRLGLEVTADRQIRVSGRVIEIRARHRGAVAYVRALAPRHSLLQLETASGVNSRAHCGVDGRNGRRSPPVARQSGFDPTDTLMGARSFALAQTLALTSLTAMSLAAQAAAPMGYDDARHLLARTGFGPTDAEVRTFAALPRNEAVARLLRDARTTRGDAPAGLRRRNRVHCARPGRDATDDERKAFQQQQVRHGLELRAWWVQEMLATPSPLTERMTLFWHNHFVSSQQKVRIARLMYGQNAMLRANALGNFGTLLHAASKDPAMLVYLDSAQNRKGQPNENFAREVMELFTLGEGHYTEQDIKEAARAFTGWSLDRDTGEYVFRPRVHDYGIKTVLARSGNFDGDAVLDILLAQPATAEFITAKLWREFVSPDPDPREVKRIAQSVPRFQLRHQGRAARTAAERCVLGAREPRHAGQEPGRIRRRHAAATGSRAAVGVAVRHRVRRHGPEPVLAAQRQGLARRQCLDRRQHAARAQAIRRPAGARRRGIDVDGERACTADKLPRPTTRRARSVWPRSARPRPAQPALRRDGVAGVADRDDARGQGARGAGAAAGAAAAQRRRAARDDALAFVRATLQDPVYQLK